MQHYTGNAVRVSVDFELSHKNRHRQEQDMSKMQHKQQNNNNPMKPRGHVDKVLEELVPPFHSQVVHTPRRL